MRRSSATRRDSELEQRFPLGDAEGYFSTAKYARRAFWFSSLWPQIRSLPSCCEMPVLLSYATASFVISTTLAFLAARAFRARRRCAASSVVTGCASVLVVRRKTAGKLGPEGGGSDFS